MKSRERKVFFLTFVEMKNSFLWFFVGITVFGGNERGFAQADTLQGKSATILIAFKSALQTLSQDSAMRQASWGVSVMEAESGEILMGYGAERLLLPASGLKVVTTASALAMLGADFRYQTDLYYQGSIQDSVLKGSLVFRASGDPSFGSFQQKNTPLVDSLLRFYTQEVKKKGIKRIRKAKEDEKYRFIVDNSVFENEIPESWEYGDLTQSYGAAAQSLVINENRLDIRMLRTMTAERKPVVKTIYPILPQTAYPKFELVTQPIAEDNIDFNAYFSKNIIKGEIAAGTEPFTLQVANTQVGAGFIADLATETGATDTGATDTDFRQSDQIGCLEYDPYFSTASPINYGATTLICRYKSANLTDLVGRCNERSINIYAEAFLKTIGKTVKNDGTSRAGIEAVRAYWQQQGVSLDGLKMTDGCGLSRHNAVTPLFMTRFMRAVWQNKKINTPFINSLPIAGETGTLEKWFQNSPAKGKIRAKTGSMSGVLSYTGYVTRPDGKTFVFSIIVNQFTGKANDMRKKLTWVLSQLID